jgi:hypothetical protein
MPDSAKECPQGCSLRQECASAGSGGLRKGLPRRLASQHHHAYSRQGSDDFCSNCGAQALRLATAHDHHVRLEAAAHLEANQGSPGVTQGLKVGFTVNCQCQ